MPAEPYLGEISLFAGNFAPRGWAFCNGQLLAISQNTALFSILGTTYGGNGQTTFALPDLRGRAPLSAGQGPGLSDYQLGEAGGQETVTLLSAQIPAHTHSLNAFNDKGDQSLPGNNVPAVVVDSSNGTANAYTASSANTVMSPTAIGATGGNQPHENRQPYLALNYIIALEGIFPSRG